MVFIKKTPALIKILLLLAIITSYVFISLGILAGYDKAKKIGINHRTSQLCPPFAYLVDLSYERQDANRLQLNRFIKYYEFILKNRLSEIEIKEVMGLCYYYLGQKDKAINFYQESLKEDSNFFWTNYDLALCFLEEKKIEEAKYYFYASLQTSIKPTLKHIARSETYQQYVSLDNITVQTVSNHLEEGFHKAYMYIESLKTYDSIQDPVEKQNLLNYLIQSIHPAFL